MHIPYDQKPLPPASMRWLLMLSLWLLALTLTPIAIWVAGMETFPTMATLGVLAHASATLFALAKRWSQGRILQVIGLVAILTWLAEYIGSTTGFPFGDYFYTEVMQPQIGHVPLIIPLAWLMMLPPAWAVAAALLRGTRWDGNPWLFAAVSGVTLTAWDLYLDPQMVQKGLWEWTYPGGYFGIPWINFFGWWLTATVVTLVIRPRNLPRYELLIIYSLTAVFQFIGLGLFWGQPGPAIIGLVAMGSLAIFAWRKEARTWSSS